MKRLQRILSSITKSKLWLGFAIGFLAQVLALVLAYFGDEFLHVILFTLALLLIIPWAILNYEENGNGE